MDREFFEKRGIWHSGIKVEKDIYFGRRILFFCHDPVNGEKRGQLYEREL